MGEHKRSHLSNTNPHHLGFPVFLHDVIIDCFLNVYVRVLGDDRGLLVGVDGFFNIYGVLHNVNNIKIKTKIIIHSDHIDDLHAIK